MLSPDSMLVVKSNVGRMAILVIVGIFGYLFGGIILSIVIFLITLIVSILFGIWLFLEMNVVNTAEYTVDDHPDRPVHFVSENDTFRDYFRRLKQKNKIILVPKVEFNRRFSTVHPEIDRQLNEILRLFFRNHIDPWSHSICLEDQEFSQKLYHFLHQTLSKLIQRIKHVDVTRFLMTKVVDELARHRRLYRITKSQLEYRIHTTNEIAVEFFRLEKKSEKTYRHEKVCLNHETMIELLSRFCDILIYSLIPNESFQNETFIILVKQLLVKLVLLPLFETLSEPDFINRLLISLLKSANNPTTETFLSILQCSDDSEELLAVLKSVENEMLRLRSKDDEHDDDEYRMKQQLNSLIYLKKIILSHLKKFDHQNNDDTVTDIPVTESPDPTESCAGISLDAILKHNLALGYLINYMSTINSEHYVNFYINVQAFKISLEQGLFEIYLTSINDSVTNEQYQQLQTVVHDTAMNIYETYLAPEASSLLTLVDPVLCQQIHEILSSEDSSLWMNDALFDDVYYQVRDIILTNKDFFPSFRKSRDYKKLLAETDLDDGGFERKLRSPGTPPEEPQAPENGKKNSLESSLGGFSAEIIDTGTLTIQGKSFVGYLIQIERKNGDEWTILRRYSEFFSFHQTILDKCEKFHLNLKSILLLPPKTVLKNRMEESFIQKRRYWLNLYLKRLNYLYEKFLFLRDDIEKFIQPGGYNMKLQTNNNNNSNSNKNLMMNPIRTIGSVFKNRSESILDGFHRLGRTLSLQTDLNRPPDTESVQTKRIFQTGSLGSQKSGTSSTIKRTSNSSNDLSEYAGSSSAGSNTSESGNRSPIDERIPPPSPPTRPTIQPGIIEEESLPLLAILDEIFDLKNQNFWFRRRIIELFRQFVEVAYSDMINKRMGDYVNEWTSAESVVKFLNGFKNAFWPDGFAAESNHQPKMECILRRKVAAKALILTFFTDFRKVIGNEALHSGLMITFELFQNQILNLRLLIVLFEIILKELFPDNYLNEIFQHIYDTIDSDDHRDSDGQNWPPYLDKYVAKS